MSRLRQNAALAETIGSFAIARGVTGFTPWHRSSPSDDPAQAPGSDAGDPDAYAQGFEEGRRAAELDLAKERDALARLAESLPVLRPEPSNALALLLGEAVERIVRQIIGNVAIDPEMLLARAEAAAALIGEDTAPARLRVNPDDLHAFIGTRIPVEIVADPAVERGGLRLETGQGWIEDGPSVRLERLRAELDRLGAPV